jgi:hypothetical protein
MPVTAWSVRPRFPKARRSLENSAERPSTTDDDDDGNDDLKPIAIAATTAPADSFPDAHRH